MTKLKQHLPKLQYIVIFLCLLPFVSPALALAVGVLFAAFKIQWQNASSYTSRVLQVSIVLMGFGMQLDAVVEAASSGFLLTAASVIVVMAGGILLGKLLGIDDKVAVLVSAGTAICGGSAIAAVSPVLNAKNHQISFALFVVFVLNAVALFVFPPLGHYFGLSQEAFGIWAAIAIHDTSSVVGAGASYGADALQIATTVKLVRALWIIPLSLVILFVSRQTEGSAGKVKFPYFILLFIAAVLVAYCFPQFDNTFELLNGAGKRGMVIALFLIGTSISFKEIKSVGFRSFLLGVLLWLFIGGASLYFLL
ncbi:putative sulfate exporter family transporter [Neiella marina]|uniref:Sulfate exporter family transporter n=1 Tax=Neiella holothuriorum TaxID=2870530 RepID=A0ABS7EF23_9GAMM|nr:putative sulfate exporter family transporter [Neiella holothuriorum]MBW8190523.1 putative sulfate exporter family transporter [Neiella holothuriorum]